MLHYNLQKRCHYSFFYWYVTKIIDFILLNHPCIPRIVLLPNLVTIVNVVLDSISKYFEIFTIVTKRINLYFPWVLCSLLFLSAIHAVLQNWCETSLKKKKTLKALFSPMLPNYLEISQKYLFHVGLVYFPNEVN